MLPPKTTTEAEARVRGAKALYDHKRNCGPTIGTGSSMPPWITSPMLAIWETVLATAPPGVLHKADHGNLVVLVGAMHTHNTLTAARLSYQTAEPPMLPPAELERRMRMAGDQVL